MKAAISRRRFDHSRRRFEQASRRRLDLSPLDHHIEEDEEDDDEGLDVSMNEAELDRDLPPSTGSTLTDSWIQRDLTELQHLCDTATTNDDVSWERIRIWLHQHSARDAQLAAERRGDYDTTPLHLACRNGPPLDIVQMLIAASPVTVSMSDSFGWLPLHYACANEASQEVLKLLAEQYPESKTCVDKRMRTPLHFALGHTDRPANVTTVILLSETGAALFSDENGMLPLHYACAYGVGEDVLRVLTDNHIQTIIATDKRGRTPIHFAMGNADRPASPGVVNLLISQHAAVVDSIDLEGNLPIHLLATRAQAVKEDEKDKCVNCQKCLGFYLDAQPRATADLLTALQSLPDWLRDFAVINPEVQKVLNEKISQRFPTSVTIFDFVFYVLVIAFFQVAVSDSIEKRYGVTDTMDQKSLVLLYLAASWFLLREIVQALSLASLGLFKTWVNDPSNWFDILYIFLILFWAVTMSTDALSTKVFQIGTCLTIAVLYTALVLFMKNHFVGFAVFVGGLVYVVKRLLAFFVALLIILVAFSQIFSTIFRQSSSCPLGSDVHPSPYIQVPLNCTDNAITGQTECVQTAYSKTFETCEPTNQYPWCSFWTSFLKSYTMMLGEVDDADFRNSDAHVTEMATFFYGLFMFAVVIVLANVLIAIVTDSYGVIKNERSAVVFWSNKLDFVAEMDVIISGLSRCRTNDDDAENASENSMGELWKKFIYLFEDDIEDRNVFSVDYIVYILLKIVTAVFIIPLWLIIGAITFGMLWPPQIRAKLMTSRTTRRGNESVEHERMSQMTTLRKDVSILQDEIKADIDKGRQELDTVRSVLGTAKSDINIEMNNVKDIVTELFECLSSS
ncbi:ion transport protein [Skeletonema marinoi]|uniref:Ion transport protein n=1 Tax=Skeletonema marinoi TaxID=267567 RepID=A0AAD8YIA1_9STRA|nr:ion transport protein [Skeletonema marinoi]